MSTHDTCVAVLSIGWAVSVPLAALAGWYLGRARMAHDWLVRHGYSITEKRSEHEAERVRIRETIANGSRLSRHRFTTPEAE